MGTGGNRLEGARLLVLKYYTAPKMRKSERLYRYTRSEWISPGVVKAGEEMEKRERRGSGQGAAEVHGNK